MKSGLNVLYYCTKCTILNENEQHNQMWNEISYGEIFVFPSDCNQIWNHLDWKWALKVGPDKAPQSDFHITDFPSDKGKGESY